VRSIGPVNKRRPIAVAVRRGQDARDTKDARATNDIMKTFEEYRAISQPTAWTLLLLLATAILAWGLFSVPATSASRPSVPETTNTCSTPSSRAQATNSNTTARESSTSPSPPNTPARSSPTCGRSP